MEYKIIEILKKHGFKLDVYGHYTIENEIYRLEVQIISRRFFIYFVNKPKKLASPLFEMCVNRDISWCESDLIKIKKMFEFN